MPTISRFNGIDIRMFFSEKHGPHFHAVYGEYSAQISVLNGEFLGGDLPRRVIRRTSQWRVLHHQQLLDNWERARRREKSSGLRGYDER